MAKKPNSKFLCVAVLAGCLALALACSTERGLEPKPVSYRLYTVTALGGVSAVAVIDCATDSVIDSLNHEYIADRGFGPVASADGRYLAIVRFGGAPLIWDLSARSPLGLLTKALYFPIIVPKDSVVIGPTFDSTYFVAFPELHDIRSIPINLLYAVVLPHVEGTIIGINAVNPADPNVNKLIEYDYVHDRVLDSVFGQDCEINDMSSRRFCVSPDGGRVYSLGGRWSSGPAVVGYDLGMRRVLFRHPMYTAFGYCRVSPDGRELWVTDPGLPDDIPGIPRWYPGYILIFDAMTGAPLDTIFTSGIYPQPGVLLPVQDIRFLPDGTKAYVNCWGSRPEPILVIDPQSREITKLIFGDFRHYAPMIDLAPAF